MAITQVLILGGGIAGVAAALAITKHNKIPVRIFEIRPELSTIGGAVNLTPNALRYLEHLGVLDQILETTAEVPRIDLYALRTGKKISQIDYDDTEKFKFRARRVLRSLLLDSLHAGLKQAGVEIEFAKKATNISSTESGVEVVFSDGTRAKGDILLGCDGIHSFVRSAFVEPDRKPVYSGIATAYGMVDADKLSGRLPFETTAMYSGRKGSILMSYYDKQKTKLYSGVVMETAEAGSREGWKLKGEDRNSVKENISDRFGSCPDPLIGELVRETEEWFLYPVYKLTPRGKWQKQRCILLGDAAHAMPPQGESVGLALEDVVLFSRLLQKHQAKEAEDIFVLYELLRRDRIEAAFDEANFGWEKVKDKGWFGGLMMEYLTVAFLWWKKEERVKNLSLDVRDIELD
jgi:2-polyprenyl-6-methoxyphenol hydroxylase-like FAD-dependent oxidoreductase